jgi:alpha 1,2-mannosyltransferase
MRTKERLEANHSNNVQLVYNNFEISDLDFWRGEAYMAYFDHLERQGGFYYEVGLSP